MDEVARILVRGERSGGVAMERKRYRSDVFGSIHSVAEDLHAIGAIDKATMREFDRACLAEIKPKDEQG